MASTLITSASHPFSPPILYDELTNEPYIPLPHPLGPRFRLTPPRLSNELPSADAPNDLPRLIELLNIRSVNFMLTGPPFPFLAEHALARFVPRKQVSERTLREMEDGIAKDCPVLFIRERRDDGTDLLLGDCCLHRSRFHHILDGEERKRLTDENLAYDVGDPRIMYSFAFFLAPSHQGQGIMSAAVHTLIHKWGIPILGAKKFVASALAHNAGSARVFLKNGFKFTKEMEDAVDLKALGKGDGKVGGRVFELTVE